MFIENGLRFVDMICRLYILYSKQGLATKSWHLYFSSSLMVLGGIDTTPLRSLLSKMVEPSEFGYNFFLVSNNYMEIYFPILSCRKIFTFAGVAFSLARLVTSSIYQDIYLNTVSFFPGFVYMVAAGMTCLALVHN